jgi:formate dehydrogenase iron-sulfur subunit
MIACPFDIPKFEWHKVIADIRKCTFCADRIEEGLEPSCAKTCPTDAILFGDREELIKIAEKRLSDNPEKYYQHIYGKDEAGGTCILNISSIPLEKLGYPENIPMKALGSYTAPAMHAVPSVVIGLGAVLGATAFIVNRKNKIAKSENEKGGQNE